jgi:Uma2 family endonuclease
MKGGDLFSPDISFVSLKRAQLQRAKKTSFFEGAPDLAVEVLSPGDTVGVTEEKIAQYFENGTRLAWLIHPGTKNVMVYRGPTVDKLLKVSDSLDGEEVVPGFSLALRAVFE